MNFVQGKGVEATIHITSSPLPLLLNLWLQSDHPGEWRVESVLVPYTGSYPYMNSLLYERVALELVHTTTIQSQQSTTRRKIATSEIDDRCLSYSL